MVYTPTHVLVRESDRHPGILHHPAKPKIDDALVQNVLLMAQSGAKRATQCPLSGAKRTSELPPNCHDRRLSQLICVKVSALAQ
jgi:hypothetical protein